MEQSAIIELIQICFLISFLGVNSYFDIKKRYIFGDTKINLIIGISAFSLMVYGYIQEPSLNIFYFTVPFVGIVLFRHFKKIQTGDFIILLIVCAILPSTIVIPLFAMFMIIFSIIILFFYLIGTNILLNTITLLNTGGLFSQYEISKYHKIFYFFISHEKRNWETYVTLVNISRKYSLLKYQNDMNLCNVNGSIVTLLIPLTPFLLFTSIVLLYFDLSIFPRL